MPEIGNSDHQGGFWCSIRELVYYAVIYREAQRILSKNEIRPDLTMERWIRVEGRGFECQARESLQL